MDEANRDESSREIEQRILGFSRQLAEEFGDISWDQFGSPFEAVEVRGAETGDMLMRGLLFVGPVVVDRPERVAN